MPTTKELPPCVRHIATHRPDGKSVYYDSSSPKYFKVPKLGKMTKSYSANTLPIDLSNDNDLKAFEASTGPSSHRTREIVVPDGVNLNVVDIQPGGYSVMHQTVSLDFSICVLGVIDHELDGGEIVRLYPGDHIVQRGTNHRWINASQTEPARLVAAVVACKPFMIGDSLMKEVHVPHSADPSRAKI